MKILSYILIAAAVALLIFNATKLDFDHLLEGESAIAAIGIVATACVILLMIILRMSHTIKKRKKS